MNRLTKAIRDLDQGRPPGLKALHDVRRAADVSIKLANVEVALLGRAIANGNEAEAKRLIRSLAGQVYGGDVLIAQVVSCGGAS